MQSERLPATMFYPHQSLQSSRQTVGQTTPSVFAPVTPSSSAPAANLQPPDDVPSGSCSSVVVNSPSTGAQSPRRPAKSSSPRLSPDKVDGNSTRNRQPFYVNNGRNAPMATATCLVARNHCGTNSAEWRYGDSGTPSTTLAPPPTSFGSSSYGLQHCEY